MNVTQQDILSVIEKAGVSLDVAKVNGSTSLKEAGVDSLEMMNVLLGIEEKYGVHISDEDSNQMTTLDAIVSYLNNLK
jgi:acyl carrier protein